MEPYKVEHTIEVSQVTRYDAGTQEDNQLAMIARP
jgi:hypothetical protein